MKRVREFDETVLIVGKEFRKAYPAGVNGKGKAYKAKGDSFYITMLMGEKRDDCELFETDINLVTAEVTKMDYLRLKIMKYVNGKFALNGEYYSVLELEGMTVIPREIEEDDMTEEELFAEDLKRIEEEEKKAAKAAQQGGAK